MIKNIVICDRCGEECKGTTYYTVDIYGQDINPVDEYSQSCATAAQNANTNASKLFGGERHYCQACKDRVVNFLKGESKIRHGKWTMDSDRPDTLICSVCDTGFDVWKHECDDFKFCPHCGAKMDTQ